MSEEARLTIPFGASHTARAVCVDPAVPPHRALDELALPPTEGVIVVHGGAGKMEEDLLGAVQRFASQSLAPFAQRERILVVDGGTDMGVSQIMGHARDSVQGTFPLVGILPHRYALYEGGPPANGERLPLNPSHTHFILVDGDAFGVESDLMVDMLSMTIKPGLALIINGGEIVLSEAQAHARRGHTLVTVRGSGRVADDLANPDHEARRSLALGARVYVADVNAPELCTVLLERLLVTDSRNRANPGQEAMR